MSNAHAAAHHHDHHPTGIKRWLFSTNHKDIGTMYLVFAAVAALIGGVFSILIRYELLEPGVQFFKAADGTPEGHLFQTIVTAHGLTMVFFFVVDTVLAFGERLLIGAAG